MARSKMCSIYSNHDENWTENVFASQYVHCPKELIFLKKLEYITWGKVRFSFFFFLKKKNSHTKSLAEIWLSFRFMTMKFCEISKNNLNADFSFKMLVPNINLDLKASKELQLFNWFHSGFYVIDNLRF